MPELNRIHIPMLGTSTTALADRDAVITDFKTSYPGTWQFYHYVDSNSGCWNWSYLAVGNSTASGISTVVTISMSGTQIVPSGANFAPSNDPGLGTTFTWVTVNAPLSIRTSGDSKGGGSAPAQNSGYNVWSISPTSSTAAADFTAAIASVDANLSSFVTKKLFKYVDLISGAWQVSAIWFAPGYSWFASGAAIAAPNDNIFYVVTCAGTPHPPTGSSVPVVSPAPAFTQTFTSITAPLNFGPMR